MDYRTELKKFHFSFLSSEEVIEKNKNIPIGILKYNIVNSLYSIYNIFLSSRSPNKDAAKIFYDMIIKTLNYELQEEIMDSLREFYNKEVYSINDSMYLNGLNYSIDLNSINSDYASSFSIDYDFNKLKDNIETSSKHTVNVFRYDKIYDGYTISTEIKGRLNHGSSKFKIYSYFEEDSRFLRKLRFGNTLYLSEEEYKEDDTDYILYGERASFRFDTGFDVAFYNSYMRGYDYSPEYFRDKFYFVNSRVKANGLLVIGLHRIFANFSNLEFLSTYLENINVYKKPYSNYFLITGNATKNRKKNLKELFSVIKQIGQVDFETEPERHQYYIDTPDRDDIIFKSVYLDKDYTLSVINNNSNIINPIANEVFKKISQDAAKEDNRRPLIPFNPGQLGLVLVSGDIDGIIDEGNGHYHVIRGTVRRNNTLVSEETVDNVTSRKFVDAITTSVDVMLADGRVLHLG